ncbi:hypothetical protein QBC37DRAFT_18749 [Rhypophila decipiens]|uniref:Uncharacterized protein n=1 Tax=Rhypophila decipiens TaxID=261697 RepID=A0AAN7B5M9_9PEZI|nr:hypothetical protein QBC37DRAFT_18749 [Rhypophila decipiens]
MDNRVILLDPPFEVAVSNGDPESVYGRRSESAYRPFLDIPSQYQGCAVDRRTSYMDSFVLYILQNPIFGRKHGYHPFTLIEGLARIIASDWITTCIYFERDLNSIEWRQKLNKDSVEIHARFLNQLFTLRRRIGTFNHLLQNEIQLFRSGAPRAWMSGGALHSDVASCLAGIRVDLEQAVGLLERTSSRVSEAIQRLVAGIQLREAEHSTKLTERLGLVTIIATAFLPFGTMASILGMQTNYGPPQGLEGGTGRWADFWIYSTALLATLWAVFGLYFLFSRSSRELRALRVRTHSEVESHSGRFES